MHQSVSVCLSEYLSRPPRYHILRYQTKLCIICCYYMLFRSFKCGQTLYKLLYLSF